MKRHITRSLAACLLVALCTLAVGTFIVGLPRHGDADVAALGSERVTCVDRGAYAVCDMGETGARLIRERREDGTWVTLAAVTGPWTYSTTNDDIAP